MLFFLSNISVAHCQYQKFFILNSGQYMYSYAKNGTYEDDIEEVRFCEKLNIFEYKTELQ